MKNFAWIFAVLISVWAENVEEEPQISVPPLELFCTEGVSVYYVSADKDVTSPPEKTRLRILRLPDGMLLLDMGKELIYPVDPNFTPVYLSDEERLIMLPDLELEDAAIGLQVPNGLEDVVSQILHLPAPQEGVSKVIARADSLAAGIVHGAEVVGDVISENAALLQRGDPAAPRNHPRWRTSAHYARRATDKFLGVTLQATDAVEHAVHRVQEKVQEKMVQTVKPVLKLYKRNKPEDIDEGATDDNTKLRKFAPIMRENMKSASIKALDKISEALKKSAKIVTDSIKDNTVRVIQHNFGDDIAEAVEDAAVTLKNTLSARRRMKTLDPQTLAKHTLQQIITRRQQEPDNTPDPYTCKEEM